MTKAKKGKFRVVMAGCGAMSATWANCEATTRNAELVGFVDINLEAAQARANQYGSSQAVVGTNLKRVLAETGADVLYDVSIPEAHFKNTMTALNMGVHVMGEKPMADTMTRAKKMVETAQKTGLTYAIIQNRRYDKNIQILKNALNSGIIGEIHTVQSDFFIGAHFGGFREEMDHPLILDMAIHTFDAARFISGADAQSVFCKAYNPVGSWYSHGAASNAIFEMSKGIHYVYNGSWCSLGGNTTWECTWRIEGTKGVLMWDGADSMKCDVVGSKKGFIWPVKQKAIPQKFKKNLTAGHSSNIQAFYDSLRTGVKAMTDSTDNIKSLAMVHGAIKSDKAGRMININL